MRRQRKIIKRRKKIFKKKRKPNLLLKAAFIASQDQL